MLVPWNWATAWFPQFPSFQASPVLTVGLMLGTKPFGLWKHTRESAMGKPGLLCWVVFLVVPSYLPGNWSVSFLESWILANFYTVCLMTKACVSFLPLYYAFNFIRCIKFKYCVFTTFKLYYRRRKQLSVFPHSCSSFSVQVEINDMQPHPELVDQGEPLSCLTGLYQTDFAGWKRESESSFLCYWSLVLYHYWGSWARRRQCELFVGYSCAQTGELTLGKTPFELLFSAWCSEQQQANQEWNKTKTQLAGRQEGW